MSRVLMYLPYTAKGAIPEYHIVHPDTSDAEVKLADAAADKAVGVSGRGDAADGDAVEVAVVGVADVKYGAAVERGDLLKASAVANKLGRAIPRAAVADRTIGVATVSGVDGDIGQVLLSPGQG